MWMCISKIIDWLGKLIIGFAYPSSWFLPFFQLWHWLGSSLRLWEGHRGSKRLRFRCHQCRRYRRRSWPLENERWLETDIGAKIEISLSIGKFGADELFSIMLDSLVLTSPMFDGMWDDGLIKVKRAFE